MNKKKTHSSVSNAVTSCIITIIINFFSNISVNKLFGTLYKYTLHRHKHWRRKGNTKNYKTNRNNEK